MGRGFRYQVSDYVKGEVVEPVEGVDGGVFLAGARGGGGESIPLFDELLEVVMHILLELADGLGAEGVGDSLPLSSVFGAVPCVEEPALN